MLILIELILKKREKQREREFIKKKEKNSSNFKNEFTDSQSTTCERE